MFLEESDQVKKYVGGLPDMIQGSVIASKPKTMQEAIEIANDLMDQKNQGHYRIDCPELTNQNHRNQAGGTEARGMVYALGG
nr:hypothetical protein [Tanacetum cinerariifolium]